VTAADDLVARPRRYATSAHQRISQQRKYTKQPYEVHLKSVATLVASVTGDVEAVAAAWLHDTAEDTPATIEDIREEFGEGIASLVADVSRPSDGNRAARKAIDRVNLGSASPRAKTVKLADPIDNCRDICRHDPRFARVFLVEMALTEEVRRQHADGGWRQGVLSATWSRCATTWPTDRTSSPTTGRRSPGWSAAWATWRTAFKR
jgi:(p)ppGpp synthase/HD superfamily hydrolase